MISPCSHDLIVTSLVVTLIGAWFLDSELSTSCEIPTKTHTPGVKKVVAKNPKKAMLKKM